MGSLADLLQRTENNNYDDGLEFSLDIIPELCNALGIDQDFLHIRRNIGEGLTPDGIIQVNLNKRPWAVFEAVNSERERMKDKAVEYVQRYLHYTNAELAVIIGIGFLFVLDSDGDILCYVESRNEDQLEEVLEILTPPEIFREGETVAVSDREISQRCVSEPNYEMDLQELEEALSAVDDAETTQEKGDTFEEFADILFTSIPFLKVRDNNLRTNTGEIDLVVEYTGSDEMTIFDDWSKFILVECKNWSGSVGVNQIRNFKGKMDKAKVDIGVIFARNGITGSEGADALRWIHDHFQREDSIIIVIGDNEMSQLMNGRNFYNLLDELMYQRRFDF